MPEAEAGTSFETSTAMAKSTRKSSDSGAAQPRAPQSIGGPPAAAPDRERIARRAYELYLQRGGAEGEAVEDWLAAERELLRSRDKSEA
jgi:hypothetical protein